ncbi:MAG: hypothetical protein PHY59_02085 [Methanobacterium sp.]|nr:hypothetical protein [Methanobacterium sp.]
MYIKGLQFNDKTAIKIMWQPEPYINENYTMIMSIVYFDQFGAQNLMEEYLFVNNNTSIASKTFEIPYMDMNIENYFFIEIIPNEGT